MPSNIAPTAAKAKGNCRDSRLETRVSGLVVFGDLNVILFEMRDHRKLKAFQLADSLTLLVYEETKAFPKSEVYGISSQMRRAAVSVAANIVEGSARKTQADFLRFLDIALSSVRELEYYIHLTERLGYLTNAAAHKLTVVQSRTAQKLAALIRALR